VEVYCPGESLGEVCLMVQLPGLSEPARIDVSSITALFNALCVFSRLFISPLPLSLFMYLYRWNYLLALRPAKS